jgi:hypothetical protein
MAKRSSQDTAAAKAKKQKIILIVGGVLLLAVAALQGPKLMKGSGTVAAPPPAAGQPSAAVPSATGGPVPVAATAVPPKGSAVVAGVALPRTEAVKVETSQLASFTLFEVKDPFVPKLKDELTPEQIAADAFYNQNGEAPPADLGVDTTGTDTPTSSGSSTGSAPADTTAAAPRPPVAFATIDFNSKPQQVQVKGTFPTPEPLFVVRSLTKKQAKISVAGGSFEGGKPVTLKLGKKVTLVNTATGVRYVLKLVYTGVQPEVIEGFTTADSGTATTTTAP